LLSLAKKQGANKAVLCVEANNSNTIKFYKKFGFVEKRELKFSEKSEKKCYLMELKL
jgi:ribosomal protein S18 acetylase RimI-like enzyme